MLLFKRRMLVLCVCLRLGSSSSDSGEIDDPGNSLVTERDPSRGASVECVGGVETSISPVTQSSSHIQ